MTARKLLFRDAAREKIRQGVDTLAEAVKVTLGSRGRTVILERDFCAPQIVNSGVLVAKSVEFEDPFENMGANCCARSRQAPARWPATARRRLPCSRTR